MFSATMCASDAVAALTMIKPDAYPKLYSVVFGEGMINDAVSIIIFMSVNNLTNATGTEIGRYNIEYYHYYYAIFYVNIGIPNILYLDIYNIHY